MQTLGASQKAASPSVESPTNPSSHEQVKVVSKFSQIALAPQGLSAQKLGAVVVVVVVEIVVVIQLKLPIVFTHGKSPQKPRSHSFIS